MVCPISVSSLNISLFNKYLLNTNSRQSTSIGHKMVKKMGTVPCFRQFTLQWGKWSSNQVIVIQSEEGHVKELQVLTVPYINGIFPSLMCLGRPAEGRIEVSQHIRKKGVWGRRNNMDKDGKLRENTIWLECRGRFGWWLEVKLGR